MQLFCCSNCLIVTYFPSNISSGSYQESLVRLLLGIEMLQVNICSIYLLKYKAREHYFPFPTFRLSEYIIFSFVIVILLYNDYILYIFILFLDIVFIYYSLSYILLFTVFIFYLKKNLLSIIQWLDD